MTNATVISGGDRTVEYLILKHEIEEFLYREADLLDERRFTEWLDLLAEDLVYFMPLRRNVKYDELSERENSRSGQDICWFDENKWTLAKRVEQIQTGIHWAEEPLSRVCHMVSNVQILDVRPSVDAVAEVVARSRFMVYQNRVQYETNTYAGRRTDVIRKAGGDWKLARREILLEQNVLLAKNLTLFF